MATDDDIGGGEEISLDVGDDTGVRLDAWLARELGTSRRRVVRLIESGAVVVDGRRGRKGQALAPGSRVRVCSPVPDTDFDPEPADASALVVRHEDRRCVIVDKPAGQPCHPLRRGEVGTLAQQLLAAFPEMAGIGYARREAGLVHRLDVATSGLVLAARSREAFLSLRADLKAGRLDKGYLALVAGRLEPQVLEGHLAPDPKHRARVRVRTDGAGRLGRTEVLRVEAVGADFSLVEVRASVAGRHQVRAMLAGVGTPLVGDELYGGPPVAPHHQLHAHRLGFHGVIVDAPLPPSWAPLMARLGSLSAGFVDR